MILFYFKIFTFDYFSRPKTRITNVKCNNRYLTIVNDICMGTVLSKSWQNKKCGSTLPSYLYPICWIEKSRRYRKKLQRTMKLLLNGYNIRRNCILEHSLWNISKIIVDVKIKMIKVHFYSIIWIYFELS